MALYVGIDLHSNNSYEGFWTPAFDKNRAIRKAAEEKPY